MIVLITGLPGNGKTLYALNWVKARAEKEGREVFYSGIADLNLPWTEIDPQKWMDAPANSIVVIDECQRVFRPRMHGTAVPAFVAELETHRHKGIDIVLITQHPMLVDSNVRRLVGLHFHVVRKFGMNASTIHEWASVKENCDKNRDESTRHDFKYPKEAYGWYKSAEVHTHKARIPARVFILGALLLALPLLVWWIMSGWSDRVEGADTEPPGSAASAPAALVVNAPAQGRQLQPMTQAQYLDAHRPRVDGLAYTAPLYDEVTKPVRAPYPAACVQSASMGCRCYSQQGTRLEVPQYLCASISEGGFFMAWDEGRGANQKREMDRAGRGEPAGIESPSGPSVSLSPNHKPRNPVRGDEPGGMAVVGANVAHDVSRDGETLAWMRGK